MTTTKITREQLQVLADAYKLEYVLSDGPRTVALGLSAKPQWEDALTGKALANARTLERNLISAARYVHDPVGVLHPSLCDITREALGIENAREVMDMYNIWALVHHFKRAIHHLYFIQDHTEIVAQCLGKDYTNDEQLDTVIDIVRVLLPMVRLGRDVAEEWEEVAAKRFVETGSARPAREAAK